MGWFDFDELMGGTRFSLKKSMGERGDPLPYLAHTFQTLLASLARKPSPEMLRNLTSK